MKAALKWWMVHAVHWALLYFAFAEGMQGAMYVLTFAIWVAAPFSLFLLADTTAIASAKRPPQPIRGVFSWLQAWATLGLLVWFGHTATALAWGLVMLMLAMHHDATKKKRHSTAASAV
jgi:hypothetical protein